MATGRSCRPASVSVSMPPTQSRLFHLLGPSLHNAETPVACYFSCASASVGRSALCSPLCSQTLTARFAAMPSALEMAAATENPITSQSLDDNTSSPLLLPAPKHTGQPVNARQRKNCVHGKFQPYCKECKGSGLCVHLRHKNRCAICKRSSMAIGSSSTIAVVLP